MAEGKIPIFGRSLDRAHEEVYEYVCKSCDNVNHYTKAEFYCANCDILYCVKCTPAIHAEDNGHKVVNVSDWGLPDLKKCASCKTPISQVTKFCEDHDIFCCHECARKDHRSCKNISDVPKTDVKHKLVQDIIPRISDKLNQTEKFDKMRDVLQTRRDKALDKLEKFRKKIDKIIHRLEKNDKREIKGNFRDMEYVLDNTAEESEDFMVEFRLGKMAIESNVPSHYHNFALLRKLQRNLDAYDEWIEEQFSLLHIQDDFDFKGDEALIDYLETLATLKKTKDESSQLFPESARAQSRSIGDAAQNNPSSEMMNTTAEGSSDIGQQEQITKIKLETEETEVIDLQLYNVPQRQHMVATAPMSLNAPDSFPSISRTVKGTVTGTPRGHATLSTDGNAYTKPAQIDTSVDALVRRTPSLDCHSRSVFDELEIVTDRGCRTDRVLGYSIKVKEDKQYCKVLGIVGLQDGEILVSDSRNNKLKRLDKDYRVVDFCELNASPRAVCIIEEDTEVAATAMSNKTIQFFIVQPKLTLSKFITLKHDCYGISNYKKELFVTKSNGKVIYVYDFSGVCLREISQYNSLGIQRFSSIENVYITRDGARIYVTDSLYGLVTVDRNGGTIASLNHSTVRHSLGLCTDKNGNVYVSGYRSFNVVRFAQRGTEFQQVIADRVSYPTAIWFDSARSRLLVAYNPHVKGNHILLVYEVDLY